MRTHLTTETSASHRQETDEAASSTTQPSYNHPSVRPLVYASFSWFQSLLVISEHEKYCSEKKGIFNIMWIFPRKLSEVLSKKNKMYISDLYEDELEISIKVIIREVLQTMPTSISSWECRVLIACHTKFQMKITNARIAWSVLN